MRGRIALALILSALVLIGPKSVMRIREPIAVGHWYPEERETLRAAVQRYVNAADVTVPEGRLVACIVPNGEYGFSGDVAGHVFKLIQTGQYDRVIILTGSHFAKFRGCSIAAVQGYRTPLGEVPVDSPAVRKLCYSTLISTRSLKLRGPPDARTRALVHEAEYGIEVVLPFLQERMGLFWLVPIVVGELRTHRGDVDENAINTVVRALRKVIDDRTLVVISTNFTHHGNAYSYRPFRENVLEGIQDLDKQAFRHILKKDFDGFQKYLEDTRNTIDGKVAIGLLLRLLPQQAQGHILAYDISSRKVKNLSSAVSYAAIAFIDPTRPPAEPYPERALPPPRSQAAPAPSKQPEPEDAVQ